MPPQKRSPLAGDPLEERALRYLARRERSECQVRAYLGRGGAAPARIQALITAFRTRGYLNDGAFAARWAISRLARRPMGRARLEAELLGQGIDRMTAARTLERVYEGVNEVDLARRVLEQKPGSAAFLRRRGFSEETIETVCAEE